MNSKKIFAHDAASYMEAEIRGLEVIDDPRLSDIRVNPKSSSLINKKIIINLPVEADLSRLEKFNDIISRIPIEGCNNFTLEPYDVDEIGCDESKIHSPLILTKDLMANSDMRDDVLRNSFLLGTDSDVNGYITIIGVKIIMGIKKKIQNKKVRVTYKNK